MSKYASLGPFLASHDTPEVPLTFAEIERVIGTSLPASCKYPAWWSNNAANNVMTEIWLEAGFQTERVDIVGQKLVFRRVERPSGQAESVSGPVRQTETRTSRRHPIFGCMAGLMTVSPGVDVMAPADPSWGGPA